MPDDVTTLSYEAALGELDAIIARLERGDVELEAAISAYQRGAALARHCAELLDRTEQTITQLVVAGATEQERPLQIGTDAPGPGVEEPPRAGVGAAKAPGGSAQERLFGAAAAPAPPPGAAPIDTDDIPF